MNTYKYFFLSTLTFLLFLTSPVMVRAQEGPVATVNIQNAKIISQSGNDFVLSFSLADRARVQPGVRYGVRLMADSPIGGYVVDEKVYKDMLTLSPGVAVEKEISYQAPAHLSGEYTLYIESQNDKGFPFGVTPAGTVTLEAQSSGVEVIPASCRVSLAQDAENITYGARDIVSIKGGEPLRVACNAVNTSANPVTVTALFETRHRTAFGDAVSGLSGSGEAITLLPGERTLVSAVFPTATTPGSYDANVVFAGQGMQSNTVTAQYAVEGKRANVLNLSLDALRYEPGQTANLLLVVNRSPLDEPITVTTEMATRWGKQCGPVISQELSGAGNGPALQGAYAITSRCKTPSVTVTITDESGAVLDRETFSTAQGGWSGAIDPVASGAVLIALIALLTIGIVTKRKNMQTPTAIIALLFFQLSLGGAFLATRVNAVTYSAGSTGEIFTIANIDDTAYQKGGDIEATAEVWSEFAETVLVTVTAITTGNSQKTIIPSQTLSYLGHITPLFSTHFTAPATAGEYAVEFSTGVDEPDGSYWFESNAGFVTDVCSSVAVESYGPPAVFNYNPTYTFKRDEATEQDATGRGVTRVVVTSTLKADNPSMCTRELQAEFFPGDLEAAASFTDGAAVHDFTCGDSANYCSAIDDSDSSMPTIEEYF